jgi:NTF2 fold immunity protein
MARRWWAISAAVAALAIGVFILILASPPPKKESRLTEAQVLPIAERALKAKMPPEYVDKYKPYRAELRDGIWNVFGSLPGGGAGGTPEAKVRDSDGEVLEVFHSQ